MMYKSLLLVAFLVKVQGCSWRPTRPTPRPTDQPTAPDDAISNWYPDLMAEPTQLLWGGWSIDGPMMLFHQLETPVSVYHTMRWDYMSWHCVAVMSSSFLDPLYKQNRSQPKEEPLIRANWKYQTSYHRALCIVYARSFYMPVMTPTIVEEHEEQMTQHGLNEEKLSQDDFDSITRCLEGDPDANLCALLNTSTEQCKRFEQQTCLQRLRYSLINSYEGEKNRRAAAFFGAFVAATILQEVKIDGFNAFGQLTEHGKCTHSQLCVPFGDYTGYAPHNMPNVINNKEAWAPLVEHNGEGFVYAQEHVTPHIRKVKGRSASDEMMAKEIDFPADFDYVAGMEKVFENVASLDDEKIAMTLTMDNKLTVIIGVINSFRTLLNQEVSLEAQALFTAGYTNVEHDAVVTCWREKVRNNRIRPTTYARHLMANKTVKWYDGSDIATSQWTPLLRVMPHAEFPSGSASICRAIADYSKRWFADVIGEAPNSTFPKTNWRASAGDAANYGGDPDLPSQDIEFTMNNLDELANVCGQSRLWGGMHFEPAVKAGEDLVEGFGDAAFAWTQSLLNGEPIPEPWIDESRVGLGPNDEIDLEHSERMHEELCREDVATAVEGFQEEIDARQVEVAQLEANLQAVLQRNSFIEGAVQRATDALNILEASVQACLVEEQSWST